MPEIEKRAQIGGANLQRVSAPAGTATTMRVLHVTSWLSRKGGGIPPVIWALARETTRLGMAATVVGLKDEWTDTDVPRDRFPVTTTVAQGPGAFSYSPEMSRQLRALATPNCVIHSHGLWMYPGLAARRSACLRRSPLVVSPHGMLEPWAMNNARWKKRLAGILFENRNLARANCLHALCQAEARSFRRYGLENPIAVIPNGIDLDDVATEPNLLLDRFPILKNRRHLLFLSRVHPKKGLDNLLQAWQRLGPAFGDWQLLIVGSGDAGYENHLKAMGSQMVQNKSLAFLGPLYGQEKRAAFALADAFVLPSFSEGFSMAALEAAGAALPILLTRECNFPELARAGAAFEVAATLPAIEDGLRQILQLKDERRQEMGLFGRALVQKNYTWPVIAEQMRRVYAWLAGESAMPETVQCI